jgi:hypothetical protein
MRRAHGEHGLGALVDGGEKILGRSRQARRDVRAAEEGPEARVGDVQGDQRIHHAVDQCVQWEIHDLRGEAVRLGGAELLEVAAGEGFGDGVLVGEELVERAGGHAGAGGDGVGGGRLEADLGEQVLGGVEEELDAALAASLAAGHGRLDGCERTLVFLIRHEYLLA